MKGFTLLQRVKSNFNGQINNRRNSVNTASAPVSYTHLDVYKRQNKYTANLVMNKLTEWEVECLPDQRSGKYIVL